MRVLNGGLRLEARDGGRGLLVLKSVSGEEIAIERSPDQLAELQSAIAALAAAAEQKRAGQEAEAKAQQEALARAEQEAAAAPAAPVEPSQASEPAPSEPAAP